MAYKKGENPMIDTEQWSETLLEKLQAHFGDHLVFAGIQGSRARGEARNESDIDFVAIFDMLDASIIRQYREIVATMERSDLACGFVGSRAALAAWPRHELFWFVSDTKALHGSLLDIVEAPTKSEACQAAAIGAAGLYHAACHLCAFDSMQNPDQNHDATKALFKNAIFAMQAHCFAQGSDYPRSRAELEHILESRGRNEEADILRIGCDEEALRTYSVDTLCDMIISWSERIMATYAESPQALIVREERETDREQVEKLIREAFNNHYVPGCFEHYLVRLMRSHEDFLPELDLVAEKDGVIVGNIMYTKATLTDESGKVKNILTFGPIAIHPHHQRKGYGKALMERSFERARELGYDTIVILETPRTTSAADSSAARNTTCTWKTGASPRHYWSKSSSRGLSKRKTGLTDTAPSWISTKRRHSASTIRWILSKKDGSRARRNSSF